jgi:D-amino-acid dehydrogenase
LKHCIIIGGGIIGLSTAYYLQKEGYQVTVIDQSDISSGASFVNAGFIIPSHFIPLAAPGVINKGIKWMFDNTGPFYIKPRLDIDLLKWVWNFYRSATKEKVEKAIPVLKDFNLLGRELYNEIKNSNEFDFQFERKGLLMYYKTEKGGEEELTIAERARKEGLKVEEKTLEGIKKMEPNVNLNIKGAVYYHSDAHMTPGEYMIKIYDYLKEKGVTFFTNEEVTDLQFSENKIEKLITIKRVLLADEFILTAGSWSSILTKKLGLKIPMQAGKGYNIDVYRKTGVTFPSILTESKVAVTPMQGFTRYAGTMEIAGIDQKINMRRVNAIARTAESYYSDLKIKKREIEKSTCGLRPCSPDGLPYIGRFSKLKNLTVATGHAMMGWSLGPATGKLVSEIISNKKTSIALTPFSVERFG